MRIRHLKTRKQFQHMLAHPPVAKTSHFSMHCVPLGGLPDAALSVLACADGAVEMPNGAPALLWVGALLPKRWARHAVTRNLIRRQVYAVALEHCRAMAPDASPMAVLVRLRAGFHAAASRHARRGARHAVATDGGDAPVLRSAASPLLRGLVRAQLLQLFERAARRTSPKVVVSAASVSAPPAGAGGAEAPRGDDAAGAVR